MSLIFSDKFKSIDIEGAIATVGGITISSDHQTMTFDVSYRAPVADSEPYTTEYFSCLYNIDGSDVVTQAYTHLKSLDKFAGSTED